MHRNAIFYALICINNHVLSCLTRILSPGTPGRPSCLIGSHDSRTPCVWPFALSRLPPPWGLSLGALMHDRRLLRPSHAWHAVPPMSALALPMYPHANSHKPARTRLGPTSDRRIALLRLTLPESNLSLPRPTGHLLPKVSFPPPPLYLFLSLVTFRNSSSIRLHYPWTILDWVEWNIGSRILTRTSRPTRSVGWNLWLTHDERSYASGLGPRGSHPALITSFPGLPEIDFAYRHTLLNLG